MFCNWRGMKCISIFKLCKCCCITFMLFKLPFRAINLGMSMAKQLISKLSNVLQIESSTCLRFLLASNSKRQQFTKLATVFRKSKSIQGSFLSVNSYYSSLYSIIFKFAFNLLITCDFTSLLCNIQML